jgi:HK97 family phage major capsid protein
MTTRKQTLMAQRGALLQGMESILDTVEEAGRDLTPQERGRYDALQAQAEELNRALGPDGPDIPTHAGPRDERDEAFDAFIRRGQGAPPEARALGEGTGSAGGYLVPQGFRQKLTETLKYFSGVRSVAENVRSDTGNALPWPTNDDTANVGALLAENTQGSEQDLVLAQKQLGAYKYYSKIVRVSIELLEDSAFDLEAYLARKLGERIGRIQNTHFTTGTGTAQPQGIVTGATSGVTAAAVGTVTVDELVSLAHSVDPAYRSDRSRWMMADSTLAAIRKLKDSQGHYLLEPDVRAGIPNTLLGYPVVINNDMAAMATGVKSILFGDFTAGYVVRDVLDVRVIRMAERYADYFQVGFVAFMRSDGLVQDSAAYRALTQA